MILRPPSTQFGQDEWGFAHANDHQVVTDIIRAKLAVVLPILPLYPNDPGDQKNWALRHQQMHDYANGVLGTDGTDLQTVEWEDAEERENWYFLHWQEHVAWHKRLGR